MSRSKAFDENDALEAAMLLFWRNGYAATSLQSLEQAMGLKRPSLYHAFGNKRALFNKALRLYLETVLSKVLEAVEAASTAKHAIEAALHEAIALHFTTTHPGGCMVVLSVLESHQHDEETRALLHQAVARLRSGLEERLQRAADEGDIPRDTPCGALADAIVAVIAGTLVLAKAEVSKAQLEAAAKLAMSLIPSGP